MLIQDKSIQNGMFSKAGRLTLEMYTQLQEKETILTGQKSIRSQGFLPNFYYTRGPTNSSTSNIHRTLRPLPSTKNNKTPTNQQPFSKMVSREQVENIDRSDQKQSNIGLYTPKYHYVYEKSPLYRDKEFEQNQKNTVLQHRRRIQEEYMINNNLRRKKNNFNFFNTNNNNSSTVVENQGLQNQSKLLKNESAYLLGQQPNSQSVYFKDQSQYTSNNNNNKSLFFNNKSQLTQSQSNNQIQSIMNHNNNKKQYIQDNEDEYQIAGNNSNINNFSMVDKRTCKINQSQLNGSINSDYNNGDSQRRLLGIDYDKPKRKIIGPIRFSKQTDKFVNLAR